MQIFNNQSLNIFPNKSSNKSISSFLKKRKNMELVREQKQIRYNKNPFGSPNLLQESKAYVIKDRDLIDRKKTIDVFRNKNNMM